MQYVCLEASMLGVYSGRDFDGSKIKLIKGVTFGLACQLKANCNIPGKREQRELLSIKLSINRP
jgi:hypothetical protein